MDPNHPTLIYPHVASQMSWIDQEKPVPRVLGVFGGSVLFGGLASQKG